MRLQKISKRQVKELVFQILLLLIVFAFYSFERTRGHRQFQTEESKIVLFLTYALAAYVINYALLPLFLYKKQYFKFGLWVATVLAGVVIMEEWVIEQIYFPHTKGREFRHAFFNVLAALPSIAVLTGFKFAWDALTKQREVEQLKIDVQESELQFLKSQINPHFLFNNLNNLYAHALEQSPKTPQIILELSGMMRYMLYECREEFVHLAKELEHLENFVNLSKLQLEERGTVFLTNNISSFNFKIAPLLLAVFVENAFKHSLSSLSNDIEIKINLDLKKPGILQFSCINNYSSQSNTDNLTQGIGLKNVQKRLEILYPNAHRLEVVSNEAQYNVFLQLHLNEWNGL